jgi:hypothetical protein
MVFHTSTTLTVKRKGQNAGQNCLLGEKGLEIAGVAKHRLPIVAAIDDMVD